MLRRLLASGAIFAALTSVAAVVAPTPVHAQTGGNPNACGKEVGRFLGFPTWYKYVLGEPPIVDPDGGGPKPAECNVTFEFPDDIGKVLLAVFEIILRIGGIIAVVFVIYGGFQYIISQGQPDKVNGARTTIINALVGLAIAVSATAIVNLIGRSIV